MSNPTVLVSSFDGSLALTDANGAGTWTGVAPIRYVEIGPQDGLWLEEAATNLYTNPSYEEALQANFNNNADAITRETGDPNATGLYVVQLVEATTGQGVQFRLEGMTDGQPYVFSMDWWVEAGAADYVYALWNAEFSTNIIGNTAKTAPSTIERLEIPFTFVDGGSGGAWLYMSRDSSGSGTLRFDAVDLTAGTYATSHIDGDQGDGYAWTGTAHASTSTRAASSASVDPTDRIDPASGSIAFRYKRLIDTGSEEIILQCGTVGSGTDYLEIGIDASDKLYMEWNSDNAGAERVTSTDSNIATNTEYLFYADWDGTTIRLSVDNGALDSDTRDAVEGDWGAGDLELVA